MTPQPEFQPESTPHIYRADVDGLRAVAVLGVLLCHANIALPGGYTGVDVFFVISGYLLTGKMVEDKINGRFSLLAFWERRVRRIAPALFVMIFAVIAFGWFLLWPDAYKTLGASAVGSLLSVSNVLFWRESGYFDQSSQLKPLLHTWSLAIEEQFYLCIPLTIALTGSGRKRRYFQLLFGLLCCTSLMLCIYASYKHPSANYYLLPTRMWELAFGSCITLIDATKTRNFLNRSIVPSFIAAICLVAPFLFYSDSTRFPGVTAIPSVLGAGIILLIGGDRNESWLTKALAQSPFVFIGKISYSLYLWHWPLLAFARYQVSGELSASQRAFLLLFSFVVATLSWRFVESPVRNRQLFATRRTMFTVTTVGAVALTAISVAVFGTNGFEYRLSDRFRQFQFTSLRDPKWHQELDVDDIPQGLVALGNADVEPSILVWGDSHAMAILPAIDSLCREYNVGGRAATHSGTAPVLNWFLQERFGLNENALRFNNEVFKEIKLHGFRKVILVSSWWHLKQDDKSWIALQTTVKALRNEGVEVFLFRAVPVYSFDVAKVICARTFRNASLGAIGLSKDAYQSQYSFPEEGRSLLDAGAVIVDPATCLIENGRCRVFDDGGCYYYDAQHLSTYGALALRPVFLQMFDSVPQY